MDYTQIPRSKHKSATVNRPWVMVLPEHGNGQHFVQLVVDLSLKFDLDYTVPRLIRIY